MSSKRYTQAEILRMLKEIDEGAAIEAVARANGVNRQTLYASRKRYAGMSASELAEFKALQEENRKLKRIVANMALDIEAYKELQKGKW